MAAPQLFDLDGENGASQACVNVWTITLTDAITAGLDVTNWTFSARFALSPDAAKFLTLVPAVTDGANRIITMTSAVTDFDPVVFETGSRLVNVCWWLEGDDGSGNVSPIASGEVEVHREIAP